MSQTYIETTNIEAEALFLALTCLKHDIAFAINPPQNDREDRYNMIVHYSNENELIIKEMDDKLRSGEYSGHDLYFDDVDEALKAYTGNVTV